MNVYDFDKTIYNGDSMIDFYFFCILRNPIGLICLPIQMKAFVKYQMNKCTKVEFKERFYSFLKYMNNNEQLVLDFWVKNKNKIKTWYINQASDDDVIISASPYFLLYPFIESLKVGRLLASDVDILTGRYLGENCYGIEKVYRVKKEFGDDLVIDSFYSDSMSDMPLARMAKRSFLVKGDKIKTWDC